MSVTYEVSAAITDAGISAAIQAGGAGPQINVAGFRIGVNSAVQGAVAATTDVDVDGFVYAGTTSSMTYSQVDADTVVWRIRLDTTVGNFEMGNIGLVLQDGTLFCKAVLPGQAYKYQDSLPGTVGNVQYVNILMRLANIAGLLNLTLISTMDCNLAEVATELVLPSASASTFDVYMVDNHTHVGVPTTAARLNGSWWHAPHRSSPGMGQGVVVATSGAFATSNTPDGATLAPATGPVGYDAASKEYVAADGVSDVVFAVGLRTSSFEIMTLGTVPGTVVGLSGSLVVGTPYYAGTGSAVGQLTTTPNGDAVAVATSATDLFVDTTGAFLQAVGGDDGGSIGEEELAANLFALLVTEIGEELSLAAHYRITTEKNFHDRQRLVAAGL